MTRDEIGELVAAIPEGLEADEFIHRLVNWAVDREREACARVCDGISEDYKTRTDLNKTQKQVGQLAAELCGVRIRGQK